MSTHSKVQGVRFWFDEKDYAIKGVSSILELCNNQFCLNAQERTIQPTTKFSCFLSLIPDTLAGKDNTSSHKMMMTRFGTFLLHATVATFITAAPQKR